MVDTNARGMMEGIFDKENLAPRQLISPPPEEILSLQWASAARIHINSVPSASERTNTIQQDGVVSKRKRAPPTPTKPSDGQPSTTPRKPKKPTLRKSRKSTPIPPYEPPTDIFTPPREVFMSPAPSKSAPKRKGSVVRQTRARTKGKELRVNTVVRVKQEIPDIDLLAPMPPPSPTDDPLLLSGPPELEFVSGLQGRQMALMPTGRNRSVSVSVQTGGDKEVLAPSSPVVPLNTDDIEGVMHFDMGAGGTDGGWSDSDDDAASKGNEGNEEEGEGEFTGKWRMMKVRTKQDPPSSATRMRQELWGRPISPFPKLALVDEEDVGTDIQGEDAPSLDTQGDENSDSDASDDLDLVKITSADPRAAAKAVAILKQHDYDCYTKLAKKRRASQSAVVDFTKEFRRKDVASAGILKTSSSRRRHSTMGVIGDKVIIPGSPVTTLPELLQRAEEEITHLGHSSAPSATSIREVSRDPFKTPTPAKFVNKEGGSILTIPKRYPAGPREWTKEDWKVLDACFTDQRINLGDSDILAPVDAVALGDVVVRFINIIGGQSLVDTFGETWTRDHLLERTKALLRKQRSGSVAPPTTPMSSFSLVSPLNFAVPDFSPNEVVLDKSRAVRRNSVTDDSLFYERRQEGGLPPTLLAPRYSHLLEEAGAINDTGPSSDHLHFSQQRPESVPVTNNLGIRVKGIFSSYLPMLSKPSKKTFVQGQPCLPPPPLSVLQKPRGPVETPIRPLVPRAPHPKDIVHLNHISLKPSNIPRTKAIPKRLVELVPVPHNTTKPETTTSRDGVVPRPRRSSGSSVKDLVRGFEQMEKSVDQRFGGVGSTRTLKRGQLDLRPMWKP